MIIRYRIKLGGNEIMDLGAREPFTLDGIKYPGNWLDLGNALPVQFTIEPYDATPPPPPPQPPAATGAQMIDEADAQGKLDMLTAALTASEMAIFVTRRQIVAGSNFAEVLRAKLGVSAPAMENFIAAAAVRIEG